MNNSIPDNLIIKYLSNEASQAEIDQLYEWLSSDSRNQKILSDWMKSWDQQYKNQYSFDSKHGLILLDHKINGDKLDNVRPIKPMRIAWAVAASIALLITAFAGYYYFTNPLEVEMITKTNPRGQKSTIQLPDGSMVILNSESTIQYPAEFNNTLRNITLRGEAFFDVSKNPDKPFVINSGEVKTTVLGTSFNISAYPNENQIAVSVASGKVKVSANNSREVYLVPNEEAIYNKLEGSLTEKPVEISVHTAWKNNILLFNDLSFNLAKTKIERWYGVSIKIENPELKNCRVTGKFNNENLTNVMEALKMSMNLNYVKTDNAIIITGNGCK